MLNVLKEKKMSRKKRVKGERMSWSFSVKIKDKFVLKYNGKSIIEPKVKRKGYN